MKLEDVTEKLCALRMKRRSFPSEDVYPKLVEAVTEYTLVEPPRYWYLLEIPEPNPATKGGWRKVVEIMKRRGYNPASPAEEESLVNFLADAYTFSASTKFRSIISALMIKVSREAGLLHHWHRILYVTAKTVLDKDLAADEFDPVWNEKLELEQPFLDMAATAEREALEAEQKAQRESMVVEESKLRPTASTTAKRKRRSRTNKNNASHQKTIEQHQEEVMCNFEPYWTEQLIADPDSHFMADPFGPPGALSNNLVNVIFI